MSNNGTAQGTTQLIPTHSDLYPVYVVGMGVNPRERQGKFTPEGEVTYSSGCILRSLNKDGTVGISKAASINVVEPSAMYELGTIYQAQGRIYVMAYTPNGSDRGTVSITVERLVPVDQVPTASSNGRSKADATV